MKRVYIVKGMHCRSCEIVLEDEIKKIPGIKSVAASTKKQTVEFTSEGNLGGVVKKAIMKAGYDVVDDQSSSATTKKRIPELLLASLLVLVLMIVFQSVDYAALLNPASFASSNLAALFTIGLTAGVSSCMALVGGLVLGISTRYVEKHPQSTPAERFKPHLLFNFGRLVSFFLLGGLLGEVGAFFKLSGPLLGAMIVIVGIVMLFLGIQLTEVSPRFSSIALPKWFSKLGGRKDREYSHFNSILIGALTFFLPCGFTQAAQIYAVSTGSFLRGALVMFFFALGTAPGLLGIGGLTSLMKRGRFAGVVFKAIGIIIVILSIYNLKNGLNLLNVRLPSFTTTIEDRKNSPAVGPKIKTEQGAEEPVALEEGVQVIRSTYRPVRSGSQFVINPKDFKVKVNEPVRFEIFAEDDGEGCMGSITLPGLVDDFKIFSKGEIAVFEFVPAMAGEYQITCAMGIPMGTIEVVN